MAGRIKVSTDQVAQTATDMQNENDKLNELLNKSKATIEGLGGMWEGEAFQKTTDAYNNFASTYFQKYYDTLNKYVEFLRKSIETGYIDTEEKNISLADSFRAIP